MAYSPNQYNKWSQRYVCAQLHSGTLPLAMEKGRFNGQSKEKRLVMLIKGLKTKQIVWT